MHLKVCVWLRTLWGSSEHYFSCGLVSVDSCKPRNQPMKTPTMVLGLYCKSISGQVLTTSNQPTHCFKQQPGNSSAAAGASLSYQLATGNCCFLGRYFSSIPPKWCLLCLGKLHRQFLLWFWRSIVANESCPAFLFCWGLCWAVVATSARSGGSQLGRCWLLHSGSLLLVVYPGKERPS